MSEGRKGLIKIEDATPNTLRQLLQYLYSGKVGSKLEDHQELLILANRYQMTELVEFCSQELLKGLNDSNALDIGIFGDIHNSSLLVEASAKYIQKNANQQTLPEGWQQKIKSHPQLMIALVEAMRKINLEFSRHFTSHKNLDNVWVREQRDAIGFQVSSEAKLVGIGAYCTPGRLNIEIRIFKANQLLHQEVRTVKSSGGKVPVKLQLIAPVMLEKDTRYEISLRWGHLNGPGDKCWYGEGGKAQVKVGNVAVTFWSTELVTEVNPVEHGRIPAIYLDV